MPQGACCCNLYLNALTSPKGEDAPQGARCYIILFGCPLFQYRLREVMVAQIGQFLHRFVIRKAIGFHHIGIVAKAPHI